MSVSPDALHDLLHKPSLWQRLTLQDWLWAALVIAGTVFAFMRYSHAMDAYEQAFLILAAPSVIALDWSWRAFQP